MLNCINLVAINFSNLRSFVTCFLQRKEAIIECSGLQLNRKRALCKRLGFHFKEHTFEAPFTAEVGPPPEGSITSKLAEGAGNCVFSSVYYLLTGEKLSNF